ncbi:MAG: hypothetical protein EB824_05420 [Thaumarchaeota archaeon S15]|nr:MAG: hypothetical protein EB824_05420 [Thaumarchaeota archaeon S15]
MMPWDALNNSGPRCFAAALDFFAAALLNMCEWRADEASYRLQFENFTLEGTFRDIGPRELFIGDTMVTPWILALFFIVLTMIMGMWCARHTALPWHAQGLGGRVPGGLRIRKRGAGLAPPLEAETAAELRVLRARVLPQGRGTRLDMVSGQYRRREPLKIINTAPSSARTTMATHGLRKGVPEDAS